MKCHRPTEQKFGTTQPSYHASQTFVSLCPQADIEQAITAMKQSVVVSNRLRKRTSFMGSFSKLTTGVNYDEFTEGEICGCMFVTMDDCFLLFVTCWLDSSLLQLVYLRCLWQDLQVFFWGFFFYLLHFVQLIVSVKEFIVWKNLGRCAQFVYDLAVNLIWTKN